VTLFECDNGDGLVLKLMDYGATIVAVECPDGHGQRDNICLGFETLDSYLNRHPFFGSTVGRYCNRIAQGRFALDGNSYQLATNDTPNHLHGGNVGYDQFVWNAETIENRDAVGVRFEHASADGDEGFPGSLQVAATYTVNIENELRIEFTAQSDAATPLNLTNHAYWNLGGQAAGSILEHRLELNCDHRFMV